MKAKKSLSLLLASLLVLSLLTGCTGGGENNSGTNSGAGNSGSGEIVAEPLTLPLTAEKQELTVWLVYSGSVISDLNEIEGIKKMEELTNVHINWVPIEQNSLGDKLGILLGSGSYPDIIYPGSQPWPGGYDKGVEDGVIYADMDTLIRKYMPNYLNYLQTSNEARLEATSDSGKMVVAKNIVGGDFTPESEGTYQGLAYRKDLLESLGLSEPKTVEEWHQALLKAKESGMEHPFMIQPNGGSFLSLSWGVETVNSQNYLQLDGDKVIGGVMQDGFKDYLDTMKQWYAEGLIDPNFTSFNYFLDTPGSVENNQHLLYTLVLSAFTGANYANYHMVNNPEAFLQPIVAPALKEGDKPIQSGERIIAKDPHVITTSCKNPELAAKWLDFQYSKEGELLNWYGIEGVTYTMVDGVPQFTDFVLNNENQLPPATVMEKYALNWGNSWLGKHNAVASEKVATASAGGVNQQAEAVKIWSSPEVNIAPPSRSWTPTEEEGDRTNTKLTAITTLIQEYTLNYIMGENVVSFEEFKAQLVEYGYQEVIDTYQTIYNRYLNR